MKTYELSLLLEPQYEEKLDDLLAKIAKMIDDNAGKIVEREDEGKKRLAYPIKGENFALYYFYKLELPAEAPAKLSGLFNITDGVMRYLLVTEDERKLKAAVKRKEKKAANNNDKEN